MLIVGIPALLIALAAVWLFLRDRALIRTLKGTVKEKEAGIERTSKLLIQKNLELSDQNIRLEKLLEAKTDFVGIASHQLRTPITEIKWGVDTLLDGSHGALPDPVRASLTSILASVNRTVRLINELLQLVHSEAGYSDYNFSQHRIEDVINEVVLQLQKVFRDKNMNVVTTFHFNEPIAMDRDMMRIAIANLISNAFHYTPAGGTITIRTEHADGRLECAITDTGVGIPKDKQSLLFQKFKRSASSMEMHPGGIGLGLYIARNVITRHHGEISFESEEGKGTTFTVLLPTRQHGEEADDGA